MSHKSKPKKDRSHADPNHTEASQDDQNRTCHAYVTGTIEADLAPSLIKKHEADEIEKNARDDKRFILEIVALMAIIAYTGITVWQAVLIRESNQINTESLESVQRAFVFMSGLQMVRVTDSGSAQPGIAFLLKWQNSGNTPATGRTKLNYARRGDPIPAGFDFPNQSVYSPFEVKIPDSTPFLLAPHTDVSGPLVAVPEAVLSGVNEGKSYVYFWGEAIYQDVFGCSHLTQFCQQVATYSAEKTNVNVTMANCAEHNCADGACRGYKPTDGPKCKQPSQP